MDQIMPLPSLTDPTWTTTGDYQIAGCILLLAVRRWTAACRDMGKAAGAGALRTVMAAVARRAATPVGSGGATDAADTLDRLAEKAFRATLLSASGGEFAPGLPDGPGALLSRACRFLVRRVLPRDAPDGQRIPRPGP
ncbi:hypothetical protein [Rhodopila globiformis]|uniref:Uncharacterized protein n=1 Tax=Rhodopila globiformis TaxID=1071 RepID=A0A2S6NJM9_RHOGL|nr:hypothetical protein [Rhodopila globiformis]PPQ34953.1 hypothetical protein CCS01_09215 [Rhodopila globiformis]